MATCQTNNQMRYMRRTMPDTSCPCHETVWLERTAGGREVAGSNPVTPTDLLRRRAEVRACPRFWRTLAISERAFWHFR